MGDAHRSPSTGTREFLPWPHGGEHVLHLCRHGATATQLGPHFIGEGQRLGETVVIIGAQEHWRNHAAVRRAEVKFFDARWVLGAPRPADALASLLAQARLRAPRLRVLSELTDSLWREGRHAEAISLEAAWSALGAAEPFTLVCACSLDALDGRAYEGPLQRLSALHTHLVPAADSEAFDDVVGRAIADVLEPRLVRMLHALCAAHRPAMHMPTGVALLFWLKQHMPRTAEKVLLRCRASRTSH